MKKIMSIIISIFISIYFCLNIVKAQEASAPTLTYAMTYQADLLPPQVVAPNRLVWDAPSGWVKAGEATGKIIEPSGDWMTVTAPDAFSLDVRASVLMDDGAQIFVEYKGRMKLTEAGVAKFQAAELLTSEDFYFITSPTVMTNAEQYLWMNNATFLGKGVELLPPTAEKMGHVIYDVYLVNM